MRVADIALQTDQASGCEKSGCCSIADNGSAICVMPQSGQIQPQLIDSEPAETRWQQVRGGLMLAVACITSPCCTPLIVPIGLALLAGTPVAVWAGQNLGWVYGGFTLISALSLFLGWRWINTPRQSRKQINVAG